MLDLCCSVQSVMSKVPHHAAFMLQEWFTMARCGWNTLAVLRFFEYNSSQPSLLDPVWMFHSLVTGYAVACRFLLSTIKFVPAETKRGGIHPSCELCLVLSHRMLEAPRVVPIGSLEASSLAEPYLIDLVAVRLLCPSLFSIVHSYILLLLTASINVLT